MDELKILIWGTGIIAHRLLEKGVNGNIIGFIESEPKSKTVKIFHGG